MSREHITAIVDIQLRRVADLLKERGFTLEVSEAGREYLAEIGYDADFGARLGESDSMFVNASTWALMLTGRIMQLDQSSSDLKGVLKRLVARSGEPVIRQAVTRL